MLFILFFLVMAAGLAFVAYKNPDFKAKALAAIGAISAAAMAFYEYAVGFFS